MITHKSISVIIPSWNSLSQLKKNLPAIFAASAKVGAEIIIVDDASDQDETVPYLKSLGAQIRLILQKKNLGFAATVNHGVTLASGDIVILLNTDVRPRVDCFQNVRQYFQDENVYAVGFNSQEAWMGGEWRDGLFHHFRADGGKANENGTHFSLWASGGQAAFSREKWQALGGMDILYKPFYWEDTDMGYSAWKRGWQVIWAADCVLTHEHEASVIAGHFTKKYIATIALRNQFIFVWKNMSQPRYLLDHWLHLPYFCLKYPQAVLGAVWRLPAILRRRQEIQKYWKREDQDILKLWKY